MNQDRPQTARDARQQARAAQKAADAEAARQNALTLMRSYGPVSLSGLVYMAPLGAGRAALSRALAELEAAGQVRRVGRGRWGVVG